MKTKEELLKIYSAYLPYELKILAIHSEQLGNDSSNLIKVEKQHLLTGLSNGYAIFDNSIYGNPIELIKPILYSMEMLTQEIEHNGERFVPILKICEFLGLKHSQYNLLDNSVDLVLDSKYHRANTKTKEPQKVRFWFSNHKGIYFNCTNMGLLMYKDVFGAIQKLIEWHFNVFGLDESEYIKK